MSTLSFSISLLRFPSAHSRTPLVVTQTVLGTPAYMPLELLQSKHVSERTDTYAFGIVLCELLTGSGPVTDYECGETLSAKMYAPLESPEQELPPLLDIRLGGGGGGGWPLERAVALGRIARRCIESHARRRCVVAEVLPELDALAGRAAVVRAGRGQEYDPMTGKLLSTRGAAATKQTAKKKEQKSAGVKAVASRLHGGGGGASRGNLDSTSTS